MIRRTSKAHHAVIQLNEHAIVVAPLLAVLIRKVSLSIDHVNGSTGGHNERVIAADALIQVRSTLEN